MGVDQRHRRLCRKFPDRCTQPDSSGLSDRESPPADRALSCFSKINESLSVFAAESTGSSDEKFHSITDTLKKDLFQLYLQCITLRLHSIRKMAKPVTHRGQEYLVSFSYDGSVHYTYQAGDITLKKHICLKHGANVCHCL